MTVDKEYVAELAVTASAKGKDLVWAPGRVPLRDDGAAPHPAADLPQAAHLSPVGRSEATRGMTGRQATRDMSRSALAVSARWWPRPSPWWSPSVGLVAIARVEWPAFNSSNQLHALTTVGQFGCLAGLFGAGLAVAARAGSCWPGIAAVVFLSAFSVVTLAMPLGATKLYLFGISVDQQFRTEYLTRLTDTAAPARHDLHRAAAVLPAGLVLDRRPARRPDRHAGLGDVQAVVDHLDHARPSPSRSCCGRR